MRNIEDNTHFIFPPSLQVWEKRRLKVHHPWDQEVLICDFSESRECYSSLIPSTHQWRCSTHYLACNRSFLNICQMVVDWGHSFWAYTNPKTTTDTSSILPSKRKEKYFVFVCPTLCIVGTTQMFKNNWMNALIYTNPL